MSGSLGRTPGGGGPTRSPWPWVWLLVGGLLLVGTLTWQPWRLVKWSPRQGTTISGPQKPGKVATKLLTPAEQLRKERAARKAAEAKVRELRKALRAKARRPAAPPPIQRHHHVHEGTLRVEVVAPTYPIIPEPARR